VRSGYARLGNRVVKPFCQQTRIATARLLWMLVLHLALFGEAIAEEKPRPVHAGAARVGVLWPYEAGTAHEENLQTGLESALREAGYVLGQSMVLEHRFAAQHDQLPDQAADLVSAKCDVIVAIGTQAAIALKRSTAEIPLVFTHVGDPIGTGLVQNLSRPGGNITGFSSLGPELSVKLVELAKEAVPGLSRVGVLWNTDNLSNARQVEELQRAKPSLGLELYPVGVRRELEIAKALEAMRKRRVGAVIVLTSAVTTDRVGHIARLLKTQRLPAIGAFRALAQEGGLMAYFPSYDDIWAGVARYVRQILEGAQPAALPVQQPTRFELVLNMKAATALGLTISDSLRLRADQVLQ
jgi:ABC-type uncharacterized transport system substrate-binding protein